jgi:hypothetical protein
MTPRHHRSLWRHWWLYPLLLLASAIGALLWWLTGPGTLPLTATPSGEVSTAPPEDASANPVFDSCKGNACSCACDDPFDPRVMVTDSASAFFGKCLNTCRQRSVRRLTPEEVRQHGYFNLDSMDTAGALFLANVSDRDSITGRSDFCVAMVRPDAVTDVIIQIEHKGGMQAHGEMRFRFSASRPVLLVPQRTGMQRVVWRTTDLVFTAEALAPPGVPYKGDYGMQRQYHVAYRLESLYGRAWTMIRILRRPVWQYRLRMTPAQAAAVFGEVVRRAQAEGHGDIYHTTQNNCIQAAFDAIDRGAPPAFWRWPLLLFTNRTLFLPTRAPEHLRYRGLADSDSTRFHMPNLESELGWEQYVVTPLR